uniref:Uncharacterized protein n=1 Tax=Clastoptera arizonana TaxID=38151 RepID=A0A1B6DIK8_9HEMI
MDLIPDNRKSEENNNLKKDLIEPNWILDRRDSGRFFWRRASCNSTQSDTEETPKYKPRSNRVKFRYDVEVLEFLKSDDVNDDDRWSSDEDYDETDEERWRRKAWHSIRYDEDLLRPSTFLGVVCASIIVVILMIQWLFFS